MVFLALFIWRPDFLVIMEILREYIFRLSTWIMIFSLFNSFFSYSQSSTYSTTLELDGSSSFIEIPSSTDLKFDSDK